MTKTPQIPPSPIRVVFVVMPGGELIGQLGAIEAFHAANRFALNIHRPAPYQIEFAGLHAQTVSVSGLTVLTPTVESIAPAHTVIVGGSLALVDKPLADDDRERVRPLLASATRTVSVCTGAFVLGRLGLLDGHRCTSHWMSLDALRTQFPKAQVEADAIYTRDANLYTSAGATAGVDLALALIETDLGPRMARAVARALVVYLRRPGGQSQFSATIDAAASSNQRLRDLIRRIERDPADDHRVDHLARQVGMSPRNFARVFRAEMGVTPAVFVMRVRIDAARRALEATDRTQVDIAQTSGFGSVETLRRAFLKALHVTPGAYRQRFAD